MRYVGLLFAAFSVAACHQAEDGVNAAVTAAAASVSGNEAQPATQQIAVIPPYTADTTVALADAGVPPAFYSNSCTDDCSGHEAGYAWAEENGVEDPYDCGGNSQSFIEGCEAYAEEHQEGVEAEADEAEADEAEAELEGDAW